MAKNENDKEQSSPQNANAAAPQQANADHLAELRSHVVAPWDAMADKVPHATDANAAKQLKLDVYKLLFAKTAGYDAFAAYLTGDPAMAIYATAAKEADAGVTNDRQPILEIQTALARLPTQRATKDDNMLHEIQGACLGAYARLSLPGRYYIKDLDYVTSISEVEIKKLLQGQSQLVLLDAPDKTAATDGKSPPDDPAVKAAAAAMKKEIFAVPVDRKPESVTKREELLTKLRKTDAKVLDALRQDPEVAIKIVELGDIDKMDVGASSLANALDSSDQLRFEIQQLDAGQQFTRVKAYLEARPGPANLATRQQVLANKLLMSIVNGFAKDQQTEIMRLVARGNAAATPVDTLNNPAASAVDALKAALEIVRQPDFASLRSDPMFRAAIEKGNNKAPASVDGITASAYDTCLRGWGIVPNAPVKDPENANPTGEVNPTNDPPPDAAGMAQIEAVFPSTVDKLAKELNSTLWITDKVVVDALTEFENKCADATLRDLFRRAHMNPGPELVKRVNVKVGNIREKLHKGLSDDCRQVCERILGISIDASVVGKLDGKVALADDQQPGAGGKMPLVQALRETKIKGDVTIAQCTRNHVESLVAKLNERHLWGGCDPQAVLGIWNDYKGKFGCASETAGKRVIDDICSLTGMSEDQIHPIELLSNAFREHPDAKGDLAARIGERVTDNPQNVLTTMGLDAASVKARADKGKQHADPTAPASFAKETLELYTKLLDAQHTVGSEPDHAKLQEAGATWKRMKALPAANQPAPGAQPAPTATTAAQPGAPATGDGTFAGAYQKAYGIDPHRHLVEVVRAVASANTQAGIAGRLDKIAEDVGLPMSEITAAVTATTTVDPKEVTSSGFTAAQALEAAKKIWAGLHDSNVVHVRHELDGRRPDEQALIKKQFKTLSGDVELEFYVRQMLESSKSAYNFRVAGGEGVHGAAKPGDRDGGIDANKRLGGASDTGSWEETLDITKKGQVGILMKIHVALGNSNRDEIFGIVDDASKEERREVLGDEGTMGEIRAKLEGADWDRVYKTLSGTADLADKLYAHQSGKYWRHFTTSDTEGMTKDVKDYASRRKEYWSQQLEGAGEPNQTPEQQALFKQKVTDKVKADLLATYENPDVRSVILTEFNSNWFDWDEKSGVTSDGRKLEGMMLNGGADANTGELNGEGTFVNWSSDILTQVKAMSPEQRAKYRNDPSFLSKVNERCTDRGNYEMIMLALQSDQPAGEDHILQFVQWSKKAIKFTATEAREAIGKLSQGELDRLRGNPILVSQICDCLGPGPEQDRFRKILGLTAESALQDLNDPKAEKHFGINKTMGPRPPGPDGKEAAPTYTFGGQTVGVIDESELKRLGLLKLEICQQLHLAAARSWPAMVAAAVGAYNADFKPKFQKPPVSTEPPPTNGDATVAPVDTNAKLEEEAKAHDEKFRTMVWNDVKDAAFKAADENTKTDKNDATIMKAVMKKQDPSGLRLADNFAWYGNDDAEIEKTIKEASEDIIVKEWASVSTAKFGDGTGGGESFKAVYENYKTAKSAAKPDQAKLTLATQAFQQYVIEPSSIFEKAVLPNSGGVLADKDPTTKPNQQLDRKNPSFAKYRGFLNDRIRALSPDAICKELGITPGTPDADIVGSRLRGALTSFQQANEAYAKERGIKGQGAFGSDEGRQMDRAFGEYRKEINNAEDTAKNGDITDAEKRKLDKYDEDFKARTTEYAAARDAAAKLAGEIVAAVIGLLITAATGGAGSLAAAALYGAITAAAAATGQVVTEAAIKGGANYDISSEGAKTVLAATVTGAITAGAQFYAGKITAGILPEMTASTQGTTLGKIAAGHPPVWQKMLQAGAQTAVQSTITGFTDVAGSGLNPIVWMHGWDEGWYRAMDKIAEEVAKKPAAIVKASIAAALSAPLGELNKNKDEVKPGERIGLARVLKQAAGDLPTNVANSAISAGLDGPKSAADLGKSTVSGALAGVRDTGIAIHDGSLHASESEHFALGEMSTYPEEFKTAQEREIYAKSVEEQFTKGDAPTAKQFGAMRDFTARAAIGNNEKFKALSSEDQRKFIDWVREAPTIDEMRIRGARDPHEAVGIGQPKPVYPPGSELGKAHQISLVAEEGAKANGALHEKLRSQLNPKSQEEANAWIAEADQAVIDAKKNLDAIIAGETTVADAVKKAPEGSPEQVDLAKQLAEISSAKRRAGTLWALCEGARNLLVHNASTAKLSVFDAKTVKPGEVPATASGETKKRLEEAKALYDTAMKDTFQGDPKALAELKWTKYLQDHGVAVNNPTMVIDLGSKAKIDPKAKEEAGVKQATGTVASGEVSKGGVGERSSNGGHLSKEVQAEAFAQIVAAGAGFKKAASSAGDVLVVEIIVDGKPKLQRIKLTPPAPCAEGQMAGMRELPHEIEIWVSDKVTDDQCSRALGGIIAAAMAHARGGSPDAAATAKLTSFGQIDALLVRLEVWKEKKVPGKATGANPEEVNKSAIENSKYESGERISAELDLLLFSMGCDSPAKQTELLSDKDLPAGLKGKLDAYFKGREAIGPAKIGEKPPEIPKSAPSDKTMPKSSVLPDAPEQTHPYSEADRKTVMELQLVLAQIKEADARIRQRDQKDTAGSDIAKGETLKRQELVARAQKLMGDLQLGGTDKAYYEARMKELEAMFGSGIGKTIAPEMEHRRAERALMEEYHKKAEAFRKQAEARAAEIMTQVLAGAPFATDRIIVGDGIAGLADANTLPGAGGGKEGNGFVDATKLLVLGGPDLLAMMAKTDPTMKWGQRTELFDPEHGMGETNAMFKNGGEGDLQKCQEDAGEFATVQAMNDAMDLQRQRLGIARLTATVKGVELRSAHDKSTKADKKVWAKDGYAVRLIVEVGGKTIEIYAHNTDITSGLGALCAPDESVLSAKDREALYDKDNPSSSVMFGGDSIMTDPKLKESLKGQRILVLGYGPTAAWAAKTATEAGASLVDWTGSSPAETAKELANGKKVDDTNAGKLGQLSAIDRVAETQKPDSGINTGTDRIANIQPQGKGAVVTYIKGKAPGPYSQYTVTYDRIAVSVGYDASGGRTVFDKSQGAKAILGDTEMQGARNGAPVMESADDNGALRVMGGAAAAPINMSPAEAAKYKAAQAKASKNQFSADSPTNDTRVAEYQSNAITLANQAPTPTPTTTDDNK